MDVDDGLSAGSKRPLESEHNSKREASPPQQAALALCASSDNRYMQNNDNIYVFCLKQLSSASAPDGDSGILSDAARLCFLVQFALYFESRRSLRQRLPTLGQLEFPSKLLRRFLQGCVVFTAHGLVTAPASVFVTARKKKIWMNRVFARVMSGFVVVPLQAAAADRIAGKSGVIGAAENGDVADKSGVIGAASSGDVADVLSYLIADANSVNDRDEK
jgi:hypothetical protein